VRFQTTRQREAARAALSPFAEFLRSPVFTPLAGRDPANPVCDFVAGNPQDMPLPAVVDAIRDASVPRDSTWFAYKFSEPLACQAVAASLTDRLGIAFDSEDISMTKGASGALILVLRTIVETGDEVVFLSPPWFFYEAMIHSAGGVPVRVRLDPATFELDIDAIASALTPRTRAVIVNTPHNPTGKIYPAESLRQLAGVLTHASERNGRPIYLLSDEAYHRLVLDRRAFTSPTALYPYSFLIYSYAKTLLTPGQRLGYVALPPSMPDRGAMGEALFLTQLTDYGWPDAVMQYATPRLEQLSIDLDGLHRKRDVMVAALRDQGYELHLPEGTFYLLPRSPDPDDKAFCKALAARGVYVLPGYLVEMPGFFRISLTATDEMIERALPLFAAAIKERLPS